MPCFIAIEHGNNTFLIYVCVSMIILKCNFTLQSTSVCGFVIILMDLDTGGIISSELVISNRTHANTITFNTTFLGLTANRHYNVTVRASNVAGSAMSYTRISNVSAYSCTLILTVLLP